MRDGRGSTPLIKAVLTCSAEIVKALISAGADCHIEDRLGSTALEYASYQNHAEIKQLF